MEKVRAKDLESKSADQGLVHDRGRRLFTKSCEFVAGAAITSQIPALDLPEVAFVGRSNVGKSSLINGLTFRKGLARVSRTPGRTQQINFFNLADACFLVDLPGYGFASVSRKQLTGWNQLIQGYLKERKTLQRVMVLIDSRHPLKDSDGSAMDFINHFAISFQAVLTKVDKGAPHPELLESLAFCQNQFPHMHPEIAHTSAEKKLGLETLRESIAELAQYI